MDTWKCACEKTFDTEEELDHHVRYATSQNERRAATGNTHFGDDEDHYFTL